jgi:hypothetical protein
MIKGPSKTMRTSSIIAMRLIKFQTIYEVQWKAKRRQSCNGTRPSLPFVEIFILVHVEHSMCPTLSYPLQCHGGTWWLGLCDVDVIGHTCGSHRFAPRGHHSSVTYNTFLSCRTWSGLPATVAGKAAGTLLRLQECSPGSALTKCVVSHHSWVIL